MSDPQYPINLNLSGVDVLVVGGGSVATHKVAAMLEAGAHVRVVAPDIASQLVARAFPQVSDCGNDRARLSLVRREYRPEDLADARLVLTCTDRPEVNRQVWLDAQQTRVWCNSADDPPHCDWTLPAVVRNGPLQLTVSTSGKAPGLSKWLRRQLAASFDGDWPALLDLLDELRAEVRSKVGTTETADWQGAFDGGVVEQAVSGDLGGAERRLRAHLGLDPAGTPAVQERGAA